MKLSDIILGILIITVPVYIYTSNKGLKVTEFIDIVVTNIKLLFTKKVPHTHSNDSAISTINYDYLDNKPIVNIIRDNGRVTGENSMYYDANYIPKDTMSANDIGTTEYTAAYLKDTPAKAWVDYNISQYPGYYRNDFKEGKRSLKKFFDNNNKFVEKPDIQTNFDIKKSKCTSCYTDVNGENVCNHNSRLEKIPISLYNLGANGESVLKNIVNSRIEQIDNNQYNTYYYDNERAMNGAHFYKNVVGTSSVGDLVKNYNDNENVLACLK